MGMARSTFYYHLKALERPGRYEAEKKRIEVLCPSGLVLDREDIITGLDNRFLTADKLNSDLIPVRKNGGYVSGIATEEEMHELMDHAERKMAEAASEILSGNIVRNPVQSGQHTSCTYCAFAGLCKDFGEHQTEQMRKSEPMDKELFFAAIREEET
jgi:ATP-dependent helicase/DNAse subunit B